MKTRSLCQARRRLFLWLFGFFAILSNVVSAQETVKVSGRVVDAATQVPVVGANVITTSTKKGTVTDGTGNFSMTVAKGAVLEVSFTGYKTARYTANEDMVLNVALNSESSNLTEVVVIGYGERRKKDITGAISTVTADVIKKSPAMSPELALQGRMPGVFVGSGGGSPNARPQVRIRGVNTFNGVADPLYIIDGVPMTEGGQGAGANTVQNDLRGPVNILSLINPADIESISVLKDASAAAIYGVRAANGVILITTKRGKSGKARVEFDMSYGVQDIPTRIGVLDVKQYEALYREAYANNPNQSGGNPVPFETVFGPSFNPSSPQYKGNLPFVNWQEELMNKNSTLQSYNLKVSGGNEGTNYYISGGYDYQESPLKANDQDRYTLASNVTSRISKIFEAGLTTRLVYNEVRNNTNDELVNAHLAPPWQQIYDPTHPTGFAPAQLQSFVPNPNFNPALINPGPLFNFAPGVPQLIYGAQTRANPIALQNMADQRFYGYRILGNAYLQVQPLPGLRIKGSIGGDYYYSRRKQWNPYNSFAFRLGNTNPYAGHDGSSFGEYQIRDTRNQNLITEITATYSKTIAEKHYFEVLGGYSAQTYKWDYSSQRTGQVNSPLPELRSIQANQQYNGTEEGLLANNSLIGIVGRLNYKYDDKYMIDLTVRRDGSSRFAPDNRWGTFPSVAVAWRISREKFMQGVDWINDLKIRANYGQLGNEQNTGGFAWISQVSTTPDYPIGSGLGNPYGTQTIGARLPNFPNTTLSWEKLTTKGIGFDAVLFKNKINVTVEYYDKLNENIIQAAAVPASLGIEINPDLNIASVKNNGIELNLGYNDQFGQVRFNASANLTTVNNKVVKLNGGAPLGDEFGRIQEGYSMFYLWGYRLGGIFQTQAEIDAWRRVYADQIAGQSPTNPAAGWQPKPGDAWFVDVAGNPRSTKELVSPTPDSLINNNDRTFLGRTIPGYYYGFNFGAEWKGFDLNVFFQGVGNVQKWNSVRARGEAMSSNGINQWATTLDRWTPTNPSTTMPRAIFGDPNRNQRVSSLYVEDAGFLRLRNVQLGYTLPRTALNKIGFMSNFRVYVSAINLFTFTNYSGFDPEVDGIPPTRQFIFGLNAAF